MSSDLARAIERFPQTNILCAGDVMLDHYVYGEVERISPEAPIPVLRVTREARSLGGAGNVLRNLEALGAAACFLSVVGGDEAGREIRRLVGELARIEPHMLVERDRLTTVKTRYVATTQQMLRADRESIRPLDAHSREDLLRTLDEVVAQHDLVIVSDYAKGVLGDGVAGTIVAAGLRAGKTVIVDPKGSDYGQYRGATVLKPNRRELAEATRLPVGTVDEIVAAARSLIVRFGFSAILVSRSQDGMVLVEAGGTVHTLAAEAREVFDVSGAGDTVVATLAVGLASGLDLPSAAALANTAAGIVVGKIGTAVVHASELADALKRGPGGPPGKALAIAPALDRVAAWRQQGLKIGFTNGCFDLLHPGHVSLLEEARGACDRLVVGLNSDASVRRLKGAGRPVQNEESRAQVLASLSSVDLVVVFAEDTPLELIEALRPDVLVKGADYRVEEVVGGALVASYGGTVLLAAIQPGHSTTATIRRMGTG